MGGLAEALAALKPTAAKRERKGPKKVYCSFSEEEWNEMEANAGAKITPNEVKAIILAIFSNKVDIKVVGAAPKK